MKVYRAPAEVPAPVWRVDNSFDTNRTAEIDYIARLANHMRTYGWNGPLTGEVVRFPMADGYAAYMVAEPPPKTRGAAMSLVHLPLGDAYAIPAAHARGLTKTDIRRMVERDRRVRALFGGHR